MGDPSIRLGYRIPIHGFQRHKVYQTGSLTCSHIPFESDDNSRDDAPHESSRRHLAVA